MANLLKLSGGNNYDKALYNFIIKTCDSATLALIDNWNAFNRGDFFEMAITKEAVKRDGLHGISQGDYTMADGTIVEIKVVSKKTQASKDLQGTIATHYLIGFNSGKGIELRLIKKESLVARASGGKFKIAYQDNYQLGARI